MREAVAAESGQEIRVERCVCFEPLVEVVSETMVPVEFIDQLEKDAGAETVNLLDLTLAAQAG